MSYTIEQFSFVTNQSVEKIIQKIKNNELKTIKKNNLVFIHGMEYNKYRNYENSLAYVYFMVAEFPCICGIKNNIYKIGVSGDPEYRLKQLNQNVPFDLELICSVRLDRKDASKLERELKYKYREANTRGEWFLFTDEMAKEIKSIIVETKE